MQSERQSNWQEKLVQVIPQVETVWWMLNFKYVHSSVSFVHLSTHEKTEHGAFIKNQSNSDSSTNYPLYIIKTFTLPPFRQFTQSQMLILKDSMSSEYTRCEISIFSGRPPALLCVDNPVTYFKWFKRVHVKNPEKKLTNDVNTSHWIDIFGFLVFLRRCYLEDFEIYLRKLRTEGHMNLHRLEDDQQFCSWKTIEWTWRQLTMIKYRLLLPILYPQIRSSFWFTMFYHMDISKQK